ncbi:MAG TPA: DNA topoisomerase (ATP-hydrolyzing) [Clostridia bacterium]|nr:DNA topoisomerase (ATP-hydrolyzing) [Clostridia bacterium]
MAKKILKTIEDKSILLETVLEDVMHDSMIPYSESVILDRAIPRVEDGLKPVQRRILYAMHEMGVTPDKPYKKSARIVGDCLGKYHPHGDSSIYGAIVRMAQGFSMRMKLIDGHGNFGSVDGDGAAAMRYTEIRMSTLALELLRDLDKDTVSWGLNFDDSLQEPVTLPGRFPNLLVNGADGIAVGLATKIPTHNLSEVIDAAVQMIDNPNVKLEELLKIVKGPDFPTGAFIIPIDSFESIYQTGKGKIKIRSRIHIEEEGIDKKNIVITELPYQVSKSELLTKFADLHETNKELLAGISDIVDESDKNGIRAVIKTKRGTDVDQIINFLLKKTNLEISYSINMVAIANGKPEQLGLVEYLRYYVDYQREIIRKRTAYDLKIAKERCEIVKGLMIAIKNIDAVIKIIKSSATTAIAKQTLRERYELSDAQAQAILDMRLKALTHLEIDKLEEELKQLEKTIAELTEIMNSKRKQFSIVRSEILEIKKAHKSGRLSVIMNAQQDTFAITPESENTVYREGVLTLNYLGQLKFMSPKSFSTGSKDTTDAANLAVLATTVNNSGYLFAFTNFGNIVKLSVENLPEKKWRDKGINIGQLDPEVQLGERAIKFFFFDQMPIGEVIFFTKNGMVKRTDWSEFAGLRSFAAAINLTDDELINVEIATENVNIITVTRGGLSLIYKISDVPVQGRKAGGVRGIKLNDGDTVAYAGISDDEGEVVIITDKAFGKRVIIPTLDVTNRYLKGVKIVELGTDSKVFFVSIVKQPYDLALLTGENVKILSTEDIRIDTRTTKGKSIVKGEFSAIIPFKNGI